MQFDDNTNVHEIEEQGQTASLEVVHHLQLNNPVDMQRTNEDRETGGVGLIRMADLPASEVACSWACSTASSLHEENESPRSRDNNEDAKAWHDAYAMVAESQSMPYVIGAAKQNHERHALREMMALLLLI